MDVENKKKKNILKRFLGWINQDNKGEMEKLSKDPMQNIELTSIKDQMNINKVL